MNYHVQTEEVPSILTAVVRRRASIAELPEVIPSALDEVWGFIRSSGLPQPGRNIVFYRDCVMNIECGVEVPVPFVGNEQVFCSSIPAGKVVSTVHFGPYTQLLAAHQAIHKWSKENKLKFTEMSWEIYGHWEEDLSKLRTDIYYLLK